MREINLLYQGFINSVDEYANENAIIFKEEIWTYKELDYHVRGIREKIRACNLRKKIVAIIGDKSNLGIAGILAVLLEGCAYLPIDVNYPEERIKYIIENSGTKNVLVVGREKIELINKYGLNAIYVSERDYCKKNIDLCLCDENDLAYIIYTSGSTGKPNGVMIRHRNICNTINWRVRYYGMDKMTNILQYASLSFDSSVEDIFCAISCGGTLVIPEEKKKLNLAYVERIIKQYHISHMLLVPSVYELLLKHQKSELRSVNEIVLAGEDVSEQILRKHYKQNVNIRLFNEYGPTENSVCSTVAELHKDGTINIGKPIDNVIIYVLNENLREVKNGNKGILYVGGAGVALGYINNEEITNKKFVLLPRGERLYCTGDVVYRNDRHDLVYVGRDDNEVKINGIRINLEEIINSVKNRFNEIVDCTCCTFLYGNTKKIVLVITRKDSDFSNKVITYLKKSMPKYLVPNYLYIIEEFPRLPNFKVAKNILIENIVNEYGRGETRMKEEILKRIHEIILKYLPEMLDDNEDLLEAGIDSISLVSVLIDIEDEFGIEIDLIDKKMDGNFTINFICGIIIEAKKQNFIKIC